MKEIPGGVEVEIVEGRARQHWTRYNCRCFFKSMPVPMPRKSGVKCTSNVPDEVSSSWAVLLLLPMTVYCSNGQR